MEPEEIEADALARAGIDRAGASGMVTLARLTRLEARLAALADKMNPSSAIHYEVKLLWIQPDGSVLDREGNPVAHRPGVIRLNFGERG
jgi:hypothetical protein